MFSTPISPLLAALSLSLLAACGGVPQSNQMNFDNDGNGRFSGSAGADWSADEVRNYAMRNLCGGGAVEDFIVRVMPSGPDVMIFSGRCANGGLSLLPVASTPVTLASDSAAPSTYRPATSSGWDGSTPFVD